MNERPMYMEERPAGVIRAQRGTTLRAKTWETEAALRMLENNLDPDVALDPNHLIVYGGSGRAVRNWHEFHSIVTALKNLEHDETLLIQSGKAVGVLRTHPYSPRVLMANSNIVPAWCTPENFNQYDHMGLIIYGQMTAASWIYIGTQGILQGTYQTLGALAERHFGGSLAGKWVLTAGLGGMSGAQPQAVTMNHGVILDVEVRSERVERKVREGFCDRMTASLDEALAWIDKARHKRVPLSVGLVGNAADIFPELVNRGAVPDIVTDQTSAHDLLDYVPSGDLQQLDLLRSEEPDDYRQRSRESIVRHTRAILDMQRLGAIAFDYGNNLRGQAEAAGLSMRDRNGQFLYPGFVPEYIRPLFCEGRGPFRWAALSGDPADIARLDDLVLDMFPDDLLLQRWIRLARERVPQIGLPNRVCWLGLGQRAEFGVRMNDLVKQGVLRAPVVIGRDHLDCGSVASPYRETEAMRDGSDAIADWPLLNALANTACGADWVSIHSGGGVGIGNSLHAGQVLVATGSDEKRIRIERVLTTDPMMGIFRHVDAGYEQAIKVAHNVHANIPGLV